ncbi:hypothetical protein [Ancylobacter pratisalsi]|uniref:Uncharacterized protein n=1 Tax=Ancylobacter pratisalsi TaxID=1745854 RepID=A0A6P1YWP5_9HYPH|nr:hypothetical protein [Ancylobacter pratisalsi]QIB36533.1 hypothetical protein G3A50_22205 [Ancylobacter pratisalsi]
MTNSDTLRDLLSDLEAALEDHSFALHTARRAALPLQERLAVVRASRASRERLEAAQQALERAAGSAT